jgi:hypothetical protein
MFGCGAAETPGHIVTEGQLGSAASSPDAWSPARFSGTLCDIHIRRGRPVAEPMGACREYSPGGSGT